jgi:hypothetical protein
MSDSGQKPIVCEITEDFLKCTSADSDRFVYSNYLVPLLVAFAGGSDTPIIPFYKKNLILEVVSSGILDPGDLMPALVGLGLEEVFSRNQFEPSAVTAPPGGGAVSTPGREVEEVSGELLSALADAGELFRLAARNVEGENQGLLATAERELGAARAAVKRTHIAYMQKAPVGQVSPERHHAIERSVPTAEQQIEFFLGLLQSDLALLFLDRTRIRPSGFVIGEHLYALGLAPGEEVVLEQRTYSKREVTYEEQNETEQQFDLELASTLSTELQEGFERQKSRSDSWGFGISHFGSYNSASAWSAAYGTWNGNHTIGYTKNVTDGSQETARRSVRDSQTSSSKVASKYRTLHKTSFKLSTEVGFEQSAKRVIKNPNRTTPITLHYFKILQKLRLQQERYGVRLCWTPSVRDPAFTFLRQIADGKQQILDKARASIPQPPEVQQPTPPTPVPDVKKMDFSEVFPCTQWGPTGDMRADYDVDIEMTAGYEWDEDVELVKANLSVISQRSLVAADVIGIPFSSQNDVGADVLRVKVHVGSPSWVNGPGISVQVGAQFVKTPAPTTVNAQDAAYADAMAAYRNALKDWSDRAAEIMEQARQDADVWERTMLRQLNPISELLSRIIRTEFPPAVRDECWEIDLWQKVFDWERAGFALYPSWWSDMPMQDPTKDLDDFLNASWARLFLPVRVGMERVALRWIYGKTVTQVLSAEVESVFDGIEADLEQYRTDTFGDRAELPELAAECVDIPDKFYCLGKWAELMPTDGTHIEVIQAFSSAADELTSKELKDADRLRDALIASQKQDVELKKQAVGNITGAPTVEVHIGTDREPTGE